MKDIIYRKLHNYLLLLEEVPLKDAGGVITTQGGDSKILAQAVRECLRLIKDCDYGQTDCRDKAA
jgi:hypothetical protein